MKKLIIYVFIIFVFSGNVSAFDNEKTHRHLTDEAIERSELKTNGYLKNNLNLPNSLDTIIDGLSLRAWLRQGSYLEDEPGCRASNHFHNPLNTLPWNESGMSDQPWFINFWCSWSDYPPENIKSNIHWATGYIEPAPNGTKEETENQWDWDHAREYYHIYLTGKDYNGSMVASTPRERELYFS